MASDEILYETPSQKNTIRKTSRAIFGSSSMEPSASSFARSDFGIVETFEVATPEPGPKPANPNIAAGKVKTGSDKVAEEALRWKRRCLLQGCVRYNRGFTSGKDLRRHLVQVHDLSEDVARMRIDEREALEAAEEEADEDELASGHGRDETEDDSIGGDAGENDEADEAELEGEGEAEADTLNGYRQQESGLKTSADATGHGFSALTSDGKVISPATDYTCLLPNCERFYHQYRDKKGLRRHMEIIHRMGKDEAYSKIDERNRIRGRADSTLRSPSLPTSAFPIVPEASITSNCEASTPREPDESVTVKPDLTCIFVNCPRYNVPTNSMKNLKRHLTNTHKLTMEQAMDQIELRKKDIAITEEPTTRFLDGSSTAGTPNNSGIPKMTIKNNRSPFRCPDEKCNRHTHPMRERYDMKRHLCQVHKLSKDEAAEIVAKMVEDYQVGKENMSQPFYSTPVLKASVPRNHIDESALTSVSRHTLNTNCFGGGRSNVLKDYEIAISPSKIAHQPSESMEDAGDEVMGSEDAAYPETIELPKNHSTACAKLYHYDVLRKIELRHPNKTLKGLQNGTTNLEAALGYQRGEPVCADNACCRCQESRGPFKECVVVEGMLKGSCVNCHYNAGGSRCSFRLITTVTSLPLEDSDDAELSMPEPGKEPFRVRRSGVAREIESLHVAEEEDEASLEAGEVEGGVTLENAFSTESLQFYTDRYANCTEEERVKEESFLHLRLACLLRARHNDMLQRQVHKNGLKRRRATEKYDEDSDVQDTKLRAKRTRLIG